jgi:uncharacterized membrane protein
MLVTYLPIIEDMEWSHKPYGLWSHLTDNTNELLRIFIGAGLALMYWYQNNNLFKYLTKTNTLHTTLSLIQVFLVVMFVYFAIADPALESQSSPALQAGCLALAGFIGVYAWKYAAKNDMIHDTLNEEKINGITRSNLMEPSVAVVNVGLAFVGPLVWTLAWFVLPGIFSYLLKKRSK